MDADQSTGGYKPSAVTSQIIWLWGLLDIAGTEHCSTVASYIMRWHESCRLLNRPAPLVLLIPSLESTPHQ